ncbi:hypothetical protein ABVT39_028079 [Epinephelus coioides]
MLALHHCGTVPIFLTIFKECKGEDRVIQPTGDVIATEGHTVTLGCTFQSSSQYPTLFWYKQKLNDQPKFILQRFVKKEDNPAERQKERIDATLNKTSVPLKIQKLQLSDSAVYYCALQPTVTGNTKTLYSKQATGADQFYWYRQYPGKPPEFFMYHSGTGAILNQRIPGLTIKVDQNLINMNISSAAVTDSAVYYCARATLSSRRCTTSALCSTIQSIRSAAVKRTILTLNVEHQLVSPVDLNLVVEMEHWLWIILAALFFECKGEDRVIQPTGDVIATEGHTVTLGCTFETNAQSQTLFWYKQDGNNSPKFILSHIKGDDGNTPEESRERFSSTLNSTFKSVPLKIQKLQLSDSAVYYCALRPTVTGNTKTLYKNIMSKDNTILHNIH